MSHSPDGVEPEPRKGRRHWLEMAAAVLAVVFVLFVVVSLVNAGPKQQDYFSNVSVDLGT